MITLEIVLKERNWYIFFNNSLEMYIFVCKLNKYLHFIGDPYGCTRNGLEWKKN